METSNSPGLLSASDGVLRQFLDANQSTIADIKKKLRSRDYEELAAGSLSSFLERAAKAADEFEVADDLEIKTDFLKAFVRAWEIADATNRFNYTNLGSTHAAMRRFSEIRHDKLVACDISNADPAEKEYYREVARSVRIEIAEAYRKPDLKKCKKWLMEMIEIVSTKICQGTDYPSNGTLAQFYYYLSRVERMEGDLSKSEKSIARAIDLYLKKGRRLVELKEAEDKIVEVKLRAGVVEVSRAWLYFSQGRYDAAKHTARMALIILCPAADRLSQANARLLVAAVSRVTAETPGEMQKAIKELEDLRTLFVKRNHFRLQARTEYELVLALIVLDGMIDEAAATPATHNYQDPLKRAEEIIEGSRPEKKAVRWTALRHAQQSRVLRRRAAKRLSVDRDFTEALTAANKGVEMASGTEARRVRIETLIARGEVFFQQGIASQMARQASEDKDQSKGAARPGSGVDPAERTPFPLFSATEVRPRKIDLGNSKLCFDLAREDFNQALTWLLEQSSQGGFAELAAICHLYLARISIRLRQFGLEDFSDAEYQLYEFQRLGQSGHAWLRRLEAKVRAEHERRDEWALVITSDSISDAKIQFKEFMLNKLRRANPGISNKKLGEMWEVTGVTIGNWDKEIAAYRERRGRLKVTNARQRRS